MHVEALILAEGGSPRLRPLTDYLPACLVPVGGTPILDHGIQALRSVGLDHITVLGGYHAAQVEQACRFYDVVRFRLNPDFSRREPRLGALRSAGPLAGGPLVLVKGDLIFDAGLVRELLTRPHGNWTVVGPGGEPAGLWRLTARAAEALFSAAYETDVPGAEDTELFPVLESVLERFGAESITPNGHPWARVETMEDLARALAAHRRAADAQVARSEEKLREDRHAARPTPTSVRVAARKAAVHPAVRAPKSSRPSPAARP